MRRRRAPGGTPSSPVLGPPMFDRIVAFSLRQRVLVLFATVGLVAAGLYAATQLPVDAVPDVTNNQVQVLTQAPALSPLEVERFVSVPVELALKSLPDLVELRSLSRQGISVITVVFEDDVDTYFARQLILEQLRGIEDRTPAGRRDARARAGLDGPGRGVPLHAPRHDGPVLADGAPHDPGLDRPPTAIGRARPGRGQLHRRLPQTVPGARRPRPARGLRAHAPRGVRRHGRGLRQRGRGHHRDRS